MAQHKSERRFLVKHLLLAGNLYIRDDAIISREAWSS
jgi:hypothetical protein